MSEKNVQLKEIQDKLDRLTSFRFNLLMGIVRGTGAAIGATIVAGIAITLLLRIVNSVEDIPIIEDVIDKLEIQTTLEER